MFDLNTKEGTVEYLVGGKLYVREYHKLFSIKPSEGLSNYLKFDLKTSIKADEPQMQLVYTKPLKLADQKIIEELNYYENQHNLLRDRLNVLNLEVMVNFEPKLSKVVNGLKNHLNTLRDKCLHFIFKYHLLPITPGSALHRLLIPKLIITWGEAVRSTYIFNFRLESFDPTG